MTIRVALAAALTLAGSAWAQDEGAEASEPMPAPASQEALDAVAQQLEAAQAQADAQAEALEAAQAQLAEQQAELMALRQDVSDTRLKLIPAPGWTVDLEGHYRLRGYVFNGLYESQWAEKPNGERGEYLGDARYMQQRLWLRPVINYEDLAKLTVEFRALDDIIVGDNNGNNDTALFAEVPSSTNFEGMPVPTVDVSRAWLEFSVPVGLIRAGRQPSNWGMGLLANDGIGYDQSFGEKHFSLTNDRVLFATKPVAIYETIAGKDDSGFPLIAGVAVDRLVEDPLIQYYGYACRPGLEQGADDDYDPRCDIDGDGITDADHSFDEPRLPSQRSPDWWVDQRDDVWEMVYLLAYNGEDVRYLGGTGDLFIGGYVVNRKQAESDSDVYISDFYLNSRVHGTILEFEGISILGETRGVTLQNSVSGPDDDPLARTAAIWGYVGRAGYEQPGWRVIMEHGYASGDARVTDETFTGRSLNPDHNVGLLLYEEVIARVTSVLWTEEARGLWSNGGVYNSRYIFPTASLFPLDNWELTAGFLMAWPDQPDGAFIRCRDGDKVECDLPTPLQATANSLGYEVDVSLKHRWHEHMIFALEAGHAHATDRLPLDVVGLNANGNFFTVQSRIGWEF